MRKKDIFTKLEEFNIRIKEHFNGFVKVDVSVLFQLTISRDEPPIYRLMPYVLELPRTHARSRRRPGVGAVGPTTQPSLNESVSPSVVKGTTTNI